MLNWGTKSRKDTSIIQFAENNLFICRKNAENNMGAKIAKCSPDTALRDIKDLIEKGILQQEPSGGRSTNYEMRDF